MCIFLRYLIMSVCTVSYKKGKGNLLAQAEQVNDLLLHFLIKIHVNIIIKPGYSTSSDLW